MFISKLFNPFTTYSRDTVVILCMDVLYVYCEVLQPKSSITGFQNQTHVLLPLSLPFYFGVNKTGNEFSSE